MSVATVVVVLVSVLVGCSVQRTGLGGGANEEDRRHPAGTYPPVVLQKEHRWQLTAINGRDLKPTDDAVTVSFNPEAGTLSGTTACNTYSANYTLQNSELIIQNLQASDLLCPDPAMNAEQRYLGLLRKANRLVVEGTTMTLYSNNREILKFGLQ